LPNIDLASSIACELREQDQQTVVVVDEYQRTSVSNVLAAGEASGVGGVDLALIEGQIAGLVAAGADTRAAELFGERKKWKAFGHRLAQYFSLRSELRQLCKADTLVCRCEDVQYQALQQHRDWRSAKLHTRCGMGPCQGRVCGAATEFLFSWKKDAGRLPILSSSVQTLLQIAPSVTSDSDSKQSK